MYSTHFLNQVHVCCRASWHLAVLKMCVDIWWPAPPVSTLWLSPSLRIHWQTWSLSGGVRVCAQLLSHVQLSATPGTVACQAPLSVEFSRQEYWSGLPFPPPGIFPTGDQTCIFSISCTGKRILYHRATWKADGAGAVIVRTRNVKGHEKRQSQCCP